jgi:hypothetical protein
MKVKIIKCCDDPECVSWYHNLVGLIFEVNALDDSRYFQLESDPSKFIQVHDSEIVEETIEEKRKRIFHKYVPDKYKWWAVDNDGEANYFCAKPELTTNGKWLLHGCGWLSDGFADPTDFENSLMGREE